MKKWKIWLAVIAIFLCGTLVGGLAVHARIRRAFRDPSIIRNAVVKRVSGELKLDDAQRGQLDGFVKETQEKIRWDIWQDITKAESKLETILKPEQLDAFNKLKEDRRKKFPEPPASGSWTITPGSESGSTTH